MTETTTLLQEAELFAAEEIRPFAASFEEMGGIPGSLIDKMASRGYLAAPFPVDYGGLGLGPIQYGLFTEIIGKACVSTRSLLTVHTSLVGETILRWGTEEQRAKYLPAMARGECVACFALSEPDVGSDAGSVRTNYRKEGEVFIVDGKKKWITMGAIANLFLVIATDGMQVSAFLAERGAGGIRSTPIGGLMAGRAAHMAEVDFEHVRVPKENLLGREGGGFSYIVNTALDHGRYSIAWGGLAIAQEAMEAMVTYARSRKQFGKPLHQFQLIQGMIGDAVVKVSAARCLCMRAGALREARKADAITETTIAKYYASKIANEVAADAVQVHGGNGCQNSYPVERLYREAKVLEIIEGTSQVLQGVIAEYGLRKFYISTGYPGR